MPSGMGKLTKLQKLTDFFLGKQSGSSINELGKLQYLQESICIWNLQNVVNPQDAAEADLKVKKQLEGLQLRWDGDTDESQLERNVLEKLEPHANLKSLEIYGYGGTRFPEWMGVMNAGRSTSLEEIDVPSLEYLSLADLPEVESFPESGLPAKLQSLSIWSCNKLIAGRMQWNLHSHPSLSRLEISMNEGVESFPEDNMLPSTLTYLEISHFKNLKALNDGIQQLTSLTDFRIFDCPELQFLPQKGLPSSLSSLEIRRCPLLGFTSLVEDWHKISHISDIRINGHHIRLH
ncbi:unnamed protein product [Dovyalis caffra]|uniref:R13L1/DRL21-like LRR repeat region domain-containing protein n=1 Tax=Dovyalis caffra TaxID=77055 RepID=A0AAV1RMU9_9ROSI|nr:unnamed protein product [Dovyalis caffra]